MVEMHGRPRATSDDHIIEFRFPGQRVLASLIQVQLAIDQATIMAEGNKLHPKSR
jgi:hypothetical protein